MARFVAGEGLFVLEVRWGGDGPASSELSIAGRLLTRRVLLSPFPSTSSRGALEGDFVIGFIGDFAAFDSGSDFFACDEWRFNACNTVEELTSSTI